VESRRRELRELAALTGWDISRYRDYPSYFSGYRAPQPPDVRTGSIYREIQPEQQQPTGIKQQHSIINGTDPVAQQLPISDSITAIQQESFLTADEPLEEESKTSIPYGIITMAAITGLYLLHRNKS
jgi:hypothetical protein